MITFTGILQTSSHAVYHAKLWIEFFTGACVLVGVWRLTAGLMYLGVRSGGWISYKRMPKAG
jgi:hypothetical protein